MRTFSREEILAAFARHIGKPGLCLHVDYSDGATMDDVLQNAPYLGEAGWNGDDLIYVACDTQKEAEELLAQTVCDGVKGGVYAVLYDSNGEVETENT